MRILILFIAFLFSSTEVWAACPPIYKAASGSCKEGTCNITQGACSASGCNTRTIDGETRPGKPVSFCIDPSPPINILKVETVDSPECGTVRLTVRGADNTSKTDTKSGKTEVQLDAVGRALKGPFIVTVNGNPTKESFRSTVVPEEPCDDGPAPDPGGQSVDCPDGFLPKMNIPGNTVYGFDWRPAIDGETHTYCFDLTTDGKSLKLFFTDRGAGQCSRKIATFYPPPGSNLPVGHSDGIDAGYTYLVRNGFLPKGIYRMSVTIENPNNVCNSWYWAAAYP